MTSRHGKIEQVMRISDAINSNRKNLKPFYRSHRA